MIFRCACGRFKKNAEAARIAAETRRCLERDVRGEEYVPPKRFRPKNSNGCSSTVEPIAHNDLVTGSTPVTRTNSQPWYVGDREYGETA